jgi:CheY-like chemotaxis protein
VVLPLREAVVTSIASEARSANRRLIQWALVVEDNADARAVLAEMLEMFEYRVFTAKDAAEGQRILEQRPVDIVLADIGLPDMDGYELQRAVHRLPRFARMPAFAVSGHGQESDARLAREAGYLAHFVKPVDIAPRSFGASASVWADRSRRWPSTEVLPGRRADGGLPRSPHHVGGLPFECRVPNEVIETWIH